MKKTTKILGLFICFLFATIVTGCGNNTMEEINYKQFNDLIENKETFVIYIGSADCHNCTSFSPKFESVIKEYKIKNVKHIDLNKFSEEEKDKLNSVINVSGTPTVVFINKGEEESMTNRINGNVSKEKIIERFKANEYIKK